MVLKNGQQLLTIYQVLMTLAQVVLESSADKDGIII